MVRFNFAIYGISRNAKRYNRISSDDHGIFCFDSICLQPYFHVFTFCYLMQTCTHTYSSWAPLGSSPLYAISCFMLGPNKIFWHAINAMELINYMCLSFSIWFCSTLKFTHFLSIKNIAMHVLINAQTHEQRIL